MNSTDVVELRTVGGATARVHAHGAHVVSWRPAGADERLYLSPKSAFGGGAAIRGGIPVIFPQFASEGPLPKHGFARNRRWRLCAVSDGVDANACCTFELESDADTHAIWPHAFSASLAVQLTDSSLRVTLIITNADTKEFCFTAALHTYLAVEEIAQTSVTGLKGIRFRNAVEGNRYEVEIAGSLHFDGEIDRVYEMAPPSVKVLTPSRHVEVLSTNLPDTVVWNPGPVRCAALTDMPEDGYRQMLCVESAAIAKPVALSVGATWMGSQTLIDRGPAGRL